MQIAFVSFGCKVNQSETDAMIHSLPAYGAAYTENIGEAGAVVINTCAVTEKAQKECEKYIRNLRRSHPSLLIAVTGCVANLLQNSLTGSGVNLVVPNAGKENLLDQLIGVKRKTPPVAVSTQRTRAFLKIQDGCNCFCTYCIVPHLRGKPVSKPLDQTVGEARQLIGAGYKELVLTGIHIGLYRDTDGNGLSVLLKQLIRLEGTFRVRLSSLYVNEITPELIEIIKNNPGILCPYFHISLQSGSAPVLKRMGRKYLPEDFVKVVNTIRQEIPGATVGADLIVGFPGETEEQFRESLRVLEQTSVEFLHVFPYSPRPGTPAETYSGQLPESLKTERAKTARQIGKQLKLSQASKMVGRTLTVLSEKEGKGHAENFYMVSLDKDTPPNLLRKVMIKGVNSEGILLTE